ncbi:BTAD domain-containing putative transcriptional regulator [Nocardia sp. NPDC060256]|uniref:BTAD domain-containing putative transcriptional regulator n=1 Tax=unclassified Nocardia TaxID=2637762 RepID=UPI0036627110
MIRCRILGPIEVEVGGTVADLGGPVPRRLLAALSAAGGDPVGNAVLAELVWGAQAPMDAANAIRVVVSRLRTALGPAGRGCLESAASGYRLVLGPEDTTDHLRFTDLVARGTKELAAGSADTAARTLDSALRLWRGRPWTELGESLWVAGTRAKLVELRDVAVEELQAARLACGDTAPAVAELSEAVIATPFRERRWELLALGLYRCGRQAHALAELRRVRQLLVAELGVEPGHALRRLEQRMLEHDPDLLIAESARPGHLSSSVPRETVTIARPLTRLFGRETDLALLRALPAHARLVTVTGPAGVGKTRLAIEYAADLPDAWLVRLADIRDTQSIAAAIATAIAVAHSAIDSLTAIEQTVRQRSALLVLDNCEHLIAGLPDVVLPLLAACGGLRILATSRWATAIDGEHVVSLHPLPVEGDASPAIELLFDRLRAHRRGWQPTPTDIVSAREVCTAVDGLPLAIELAAARAHSFGLAGLTTHLRRRLDVLGRTARGSVSPHDSLDAAIGWSIEQLSDADRSLLLRLWPFEGGFTWQAVESVRPDTADAAVVATLAALVDRSMLTADVTTGHARYRMLETIRRYCRAIDPDATDTQRAHAQWIRDLIADQVALFGTPAFGDAIQVLGNELANIRSGIDYDLEHEPEQALRSTGALGYMWVTAGAVPEGLRLLRSALHACPDAPAADRARALSALALTSCHVGDAQTGLSAAEQALALLDDTDPAHDLLLLDAHLRRCNALADLYSPELRAGAEAFAAACAHRDPPGYLRATALWGLGLAEFRDGKPDAAAEILTRAHEISVQHSFVPGAAITDLLLAWCVLADPSGGQPTARHALNLLARAVAAFGQQPNYSDALCAVHAGAFALAELGMHDVASQLSSAVAQHADRIGTDPTRYMRGAGPELDARVTRLLPTTPPPPNPMSWDAMIDLFTRTASDLPVTR